VGLAGTGGLALGVALGVALGGMPRILETPCDVGMWPESTVRRPDGQMPADASSDGQTRTEVQ
jgi:hypothetical protein